jgi:hypothetical protein
MPLDVEEQLPEPADLKGLFVFVDNDEVVAAKRTHYEMNESMFRSHFATCPDAEDWRGHTR